MNIPLPVASECASDAERQISVSISSVTLETGYAAGRQTISVTEPTQALTGASEQFSFHGDNAVYSHRTELCQRSKVDLRPLDCAASAARNDTATIPD